MAFVPTISNEETASLEAVSYDGPTYVITDVRSLEKACEFLSSQKVLGFDTESRPSFTPGSHNRIALLQLYGGGKCFLIRLNKVPLIRQLQAILKDENIKKIGLDVKGDISELNTLRRFKPGGFIDLQSIVGAYGIQELGLRKISAIVLGKRVSKAQRLSNWSANRLTEQQITYAATDAWVCVKIYDALLASGKE